jgi:glycosyltransferase involved in cell wall biosynthesis
MKKVSVIMPTYNRCDFICRAINSVLNQTYSNFEIIVIDDNGENSSVRKEMIEIMQKYQLDSRVKYIKNSKNMGGALARNIGIKEASGEYITFLDDDDVYLPTKIEVQYNAMIQNGWDVSIMDGATYNSEGKLLSKKKQMISTNPNYQELMVAHLMYHLTNTNTFMFKKESLESIGGFDDIIACQEYILMLKAINGDLNIGYIPQTLVACYIHEGERISTGEKKVRAEYILIEEKKKYFDLLNQSQRKYVLCRHHGVLFYVQLKRKKYAIALVHALKGFAYSPLGTYDLYKEYKGKLKQ